MKCQKLQMQENQKKLKFTDKVVDCRYSKTGRLFTSLPVLRYMKACLLEDMTKAKDNEANDRDKKGEIFDAFDGIRIVQRDVDNAWDITCQK